MVGIYLDPETHDLVIEGTQLKQVSGLEEVRQRVKVHLLMILGLWGWNTTTGFPWREVMRQKPFRKSAVTAKLRATIRRIEGVSKVLSVRLEHDETERTVTVHADIETQYGPTTATVST